MAKFCGKIGYSLTEETSPGVYSPSIIERLYYGDVIRNVRNLQGTDKVNSDITINNSISILADAYATEHMFAMRYVWWHGARWRITNVEEQRPRLILTLGEVYNG